MTQVMLFDYAVLDSNTRTFVQERAENIRSHLKNTAESVIAIGFDLLEVKAQLGHGQFMNWVEVEFGMTHQSAKRFMDVAKRFGNQNQHFVDFPVSVLYELAAPSTPDTVVEMVQTGQIPATLLAIREAKQAEKQIEPERVSLADVFDPVAQTIPTAYLPKPIYQTPVYHAPEPIVDEEEDEEDWKFESSMEETKEVPHAPIDKMNYNAPTLEDEKETIVLASVSRGVPPALQSSESNEWYTPSRYIEAARELMGGIDTDPASNELANQTVQAMLYYDAKSNGLNRIWIGRVWLNPPYGFTDGKSNQEIWTQKLFQELERGSCYEAVLLVNANTEAKWFQPLYDHLICFTDHRIRFYNATGDSSQPTQGNALIYFGRKPEQQERFKQIFRQFGRIGQFN